MNRISVAALALISIAVSGCDVAAEDSTQIERRNTEQQAKQAATIVGAPAIINFAEKRQLKMIYELRDTANLVTYTYIVDLNGKRHSVCPSTSVGYGIPYATQFTNPQRVAIKEYQTGVATLPQADPNALFSPASADGTWILCLHPVTKELAPAYVEPRVVVYLFEMPHVD